MVIKKYYFAALFALVLVSLLGFAVASDVGIMGPGISVYITYPNASAAYNYHVSNFSWSITPWTSLSSCWYTLNGGAEVFVNCADNFSTFAPGLADGSYDLHFVANKSITQVWDDELTFSVDTTPPLFINEIHPANPITYVNGAVYEFNVTVTDAGVGVNSVWIEFDGMNHSVSDSGSGVYSFVVYDLAADDYDYEWYATDNLGNADSTGVYTYTVDQADPRLGMNITGTGTIIYGTYSDFMGSEINEGDGGCLYVMNPTNDNLFGAGTVTFTYSTAGCQNYSAGSVTRDLTILQAPTTTTLTPSVASPIVYGNAVSFSCSNSAGLSTELYIDGVDRTLDMGVDLVLGAKTSYNVTCFGIENQNYTGSSDSMNFVVDKAPQNAVLSFSAASPINYETLENVTCNGVLFRNDVDVSAEIGQDVLLGAGSYNYSCELFENENYTYAESNATLVVNRADPSDPIIMNPAMSIVISPGTGVYAGTETNATGIGCPSQLVCTLYRNGTEVNNSDINIFEVGVYDYVFNTTGNENYSAAEVTATLSVTNAPGPSGGGGGYYSSGSCSSNWTCTNWSICSSSNTQTRVCSPISQFCTAYGQKPAEIKVCDVGGTNKTFVEEVSSSGQNASSQGRAGITGAVIGALSGGSWVLILVFAAAIAGAYGFVVYRRKKFQSDLERTLWQAATNKK